MRYFVQDLNGTAINDGMWKCLNSTCGLACDPGFRSSVKDPVFNITDCKIPHHYCEPKVLVAQDRNSSDIQALSDECSSSNVVRQTFSAIGEDMPVICEKVEDALNVTSCLSIKEQNNFIYFHPANNNTKIEMVNYLKLPAKLLKKFTKVSKPLSNGRFCEDENSVCTFFSNSILIFSLGAVHSGSCMVHLDHATLALIGDSWSLMVRIVSGEARFTKLPSLQTARLGSIHI